MEHLREGLAEARRIVSAESVAIYRVQGTAALLITYSGMQPPRHLRVKKLGAEPYRKTVSGKGWWLIPVNQKVDESPLIVALTFGTTGGRRGDRQKGLLAGSLISLYLQHTEERRQILQSVPVSGVWTDERGRVVAVTGLAQSLIPDLRDAVGLPISQVLPLLPFRSATTAPSAGGAALREKAQGITVTASVIYRNGLRFWIIADAQREAESPQILRRLKRLTRILKHVVSNSLQAFQSNAELLLLRGLEDPEWSYRLQDNLLTSDQIAQAINAMVRLTESWKEQRVALVPIQEAFESAQDLALRQGAPIAVELSLPKPSPVVFGYFGELREVFYQILRHCTEERKDISHWQASGYWSDRSLLLEIRPSGPTTEMATEAGQNKVWSFVSDEAHSVGDLRIMISAGLVAEMGGDLLICSVNGRLTGLRLNLPAVVRAD